MDGLGNGVRQGECHEGLIGLDDFDELDAAVVGLAFGRAVGGDGFGVAVFPIHIFEGLACGLVWLFGGRRIGSQLSVVSGQLSVLLRLRGCWGWWLRL
jgi:hypothetical protein